MVLAFRFVHTTSTPSNCDAPSDDYEWSVRFVAVQQRSRLNAPPFQWTGPHPTVNTSTEYSLARATQFHCDSPSARPCIVSLCAACAVPVWRSGVGRRGLRGVRVLYIYISNSAPKNSKTPRALCREAALDTVTDSQSCSLSLVRSSSQLLYYSQKWLAHQERPSVQRVQLPGIAIPSSASW